MAGSPEYGTSIESYKLPVCNVDKERRNFPGKEKDTYYTLEDMKDNNPYLKEHSGTTDTDSETDSSSNYNGYAKIYRKKGKVKDWSGKKLSTDSVSVAKDTKVYGTYGLGGSAKKSEAYDTMSRGR